MISQDTKNAAGGFVLAFVIVASVCLFIVSRANASGPSKEDLEHFANVKKNQVCLTETRPAHDRVVSASANGKRIDEADVPSYNRFIECKDWNKAEVKALNENNWNVQWDTMQLIPLTLGQPMAPKASVQESRSTNVAPSQTDGSLFVWENAPAYKNDRLKAYQRMLSARGVTKPEHVKLLVAQIIQENGSLSETVHGDGGCSVGILQYNACAHHKMSAKRFLEIHPEWRSWEYQLERMADMVADRYELYDGDIKRIIVHHNRPASAKAGKDTAAGYFRTISKKTSLLTSL